ARADADGHDDVAVFVVIRRVHRAQLAGRLSVLELQLDFSSVGSLEEIQQVLGVEADGHGFAVVRGFDGVFRFAGLGGGGRDLDFIAVQAHADGARPLVSKLRNTQDGAGNFFARNRDRLVVVTR